MIIKQIQLGNVEVIKAFLGNSQIYRKVNINPILALFAQGQGGTWLEPIDITTLYQDAAGTVPTVTAGDPIALVKDKSGNNNNAVQTVSSKRPIYSVSPSRITLDKVDDEFVIPVPTGGYIGSMTIASTTGTATYGVNIPAGNFTLGGQYFPSTNIVGAVIRNGAMTVEEEITTEDYFVEKGAVKSFMGVTNFTTFWQFHSKLTRFPLIETSAGTNFYQAWNGCTGLISFPLLNTSAGTNFYQAWQNCSGLTSFPLINTSLATNLGATWQGCNKLTSFPLLNTSATVNFYATWQNCTSLTSFPLIDTSAGTYFGYAWYGCNKLTSFPLINTSLGTYFGYAWRGCTALANFPANMFDNIKGGDFTDAFLGTNLTQTSLDNILTSLVTSGIATDTRAFKQSGGSAPSITGTAAIDTLRSRGWTVTVTGGY